ncbi:MAG: translesion DNA synthesis-associated protein ImuA [Burkholderiaceae bacterium]|nr:translesion DNA synthesis-associated protein ImuA [Burkholderiaceae bacterium]MDH3461078.1 translesion DNA synthesis-associated protein ImuA [Burkholderiaceae bacterium]
MAAQVWRGNQLGSAQGRVCPSGFKTLDTELPGGGWPCCAITEVLQPQCSAAEWRLLLPGLAALATPQRPLLVVGAPQQPYFGGLRLYGASEQCVVLVCAQTPAQQLWATEQALKTEGLAAVVAWLPHARAEQIRRLQACASRCLAPAFLLRPQATQFESSAAPLRVQIRLGGMHTLAVHILKRRGPMHEGWITLNALPPHLVDVLSRQSAHAEPEQEGAGAVLDGAVGRPALAVASA